MVHKVKGVVLKQSNDDLGKQDGARGVLGGE